jgi:hypothetical protein
MPPWTDWLMDGRKQSAELCVTIPKSHVQDCAAHQMCTCVVPQSLTVPDEKPGVVTGWDKAGTDRTQKSIFQPPRAPNFRPRLSNLDPRMVSRAAEESTPHSLSTQQIPRDLPFTLGCKGSSSSGCHSTTSASSVNVLRLVPLGVFIV